MKYRDEPNMSDTTILMSVEDLINRAMGPPDKNVINYKLVQTVLHILARQMRMLEQRVEVRIEEHLSPRERREKTKKVEISTDSSSSKSSRPHTSKGRMGEISEETERDKEKEKSERPIYKGEQKQYTEIDTAIKSTHKEIEIEEQGETTKSEKGTKQKAKQKTISKKRDKSEKELIKEDEKEELEMLNDREKSEKVTVKEKEREERSTVKDKEKVVTKEKVKAEKAISKEREDKANIVSKERPGEDKKETEDKVMRKEKERSEKNATKDKQKDEKDTLKEKEREEQGGIKDKIKELKVQDKVDKTATTYKKKEEYQKSDKVTPKEREKMETEAIKERDMEEKLLQKDKELAEMAAKTKLKRDKKGKSRVGSRTSIVISEVERQKEKVLVVEKGPTTRVDSRGRESLEVVTRSEFEILEALVNDLKKNVGPLPTPALPDNKQLRSELAKGSASLIDIMNAMQVKARVEAAEQAIGRMSELLTELAAVGALPEDFANRIVEVQFEPLDTLKPNDTIEPLEAFELPLDTSADKSRIIPGKSVAIDPASIKSVAPRPAQSVLSPFKASIGMPSLASRLSTAPTLSSLPKVTHIEMDDALRSLKEDLSRNVNLIVSKASAAADMAVSMAKSVSEKLNVAVQLNTRVSTLHSLVSDYSEQLSGFDAGLSTQMQGFQDQIDQLRSDLKDGLTQLEQVNNNAETVAVMDLTERYGGLVSELDHTLHLHKSLTSFQKQLGDELHSLVDSVEMLREQKADRDEVLDGLRDKADNSRLAGLLSELEFAASRAELDRRLEICYEKFYKQDSVWMEAIKDLSQMVGKKAELMQLLSTQDETQQQLRELHEKLHVLALALGEPKAAILTRKICRDATCGACMVPALMEAVEVNHGAPPPLPALRPRPTGAPAEESALCLKEWKLPEYADDRDHVCHRWCGGSHTIISDAVTHRQALPLQLQSIPTKRFTGYGSDGKSYMMEEELDPCLECNPVVDQSKEAPLPSEEGDGDHGILKTSGPSRNY